MGVKEYWQELAKKHGLTDDEAKVILEALGDEKVAKVVADGFVSRSDYSRDLDKMRDEWKGKAEQNEELVKQWNKWYEENGKPMYTGYLTSSEQLKKYRELYGELGDGSDPNNQKPKPVADTYTKQELEELLNQRDQTKDKGIVDLWKHGMKFVSDWSRRFPGEELPVDELVKSIEDAKVPPDVGYERFIAPRVEAQQKAALEERIKREREEAVRDALSKHHLPVDVKPKEPHPFFDPVERKADATPVERRMESQNAFLEALNAPDEFKG